MLNYHNNLLEEKLGRTKFFSNSLLGSDISDNEYFASISLDSIPFTIRFKHTLKILNMDYLNDLLNSDEYILRSIKNCGEKSINDARLTILHYLDGITQGKYIELNKLRAEVSAFNYSPESKYIPFLKQKMDISDEEILQLNNIKLLDINLPARLERYFEKYSESMTIGDLLKIEISELLSYSNIGRKSITDLQAEIKNIIINNKTVSNNDNLIKKAADIIEEYLDKCDDRTKKIFSLRWGSNEINTLEYIGNILNLTRERVRQIIYKNLKSIKKLFLRDLDTYLEYFLNFIIQNATAISFDQMMGEEQYDFQYPKYLFEGILAELFEEVPFKNYSSKSFTQRLIKEPSSDISFSGLYEALHKLHLPFGKVTHDKLFELLKITSLREKLMLLNNIYNTSEYKFCCKSNSPYFLIRRRNLIEITIDVLQGFDKPITIDFLLDIVKEYYPVGGKYISLSAVMSYLKSSKSLYQLDRYLIGLDRHFSYDIVEWSDICYKIKIYIRELKRQTNSIELFNFIKVHYPLIRSKYELVYILRNDEDIIDLGFFNYSLKEFGHEERLKITDAIKELFLTEDCPKSITDIQKKISEQRFIRIEGMQGILQTQSYLKNYGGNFYGLIDLDTSNLIHLALNETFITKILTYEIFPDTSIKAIVNYLGINGEYEKNILFTISKSKGLFLYNESNNGISFVISKTWSHVKITRCILYNLDRSLFWDELNWIFDDIGFIIDALSKNKISQHKNIYVEGNKLKYIDIKLNKNEAEDIANICFDKLKNEVEPSSVEEICEFVNAEITDISNQELIYILEKDDRFIIIDNQLIMIN